MTVRPAAILMAFALAAQTPAPPPIAGFRPDAARKQAELESRFDAGVNRQNFQQLARTALGEAPSRGLAGQP